jgi:hypothetical protein
MLPDLAGEAANFVFAGAHAATNSATSAAKMSVLAKATKTRIFLAPGVIFAAWCTRNAAVTSSEMVLVVNQVAANPTITITDVESIAITNENLSLITETAVISAGG